MFEILIDAKMKNFVCTNRSFTSSKDYTCSLIREQLNDWSSHSQVK